jgi:hypothetical protein
MRQIVKAKGAVALLAVLAVSAPARTHEKPRLLDRVVPLPMALSDDFQFRKTKLYLLTGAEPGHEKSPEQTLQGAAKAGKLGGTAPSTKTTTVQDASIKFERAYRLFGAVTKLDEHERQGNYFDFFWRARRPANLTVRLEYKQEKLHAHIQAQELSYPNARGNYKTEFKVIGDDYFDDGQVTAWRCSLIENGTIVAETHSFMWQ